MWLAFYAAALGKYRAERLQFLTGVTHHLTLICQLPLGSRSATALNKPMVGVDTDVVNLNTLRFSLQGSSEMDKPPKRWGH